MTDKKTTKVSIYCRIASAMGDVHILGKKERNNHQSYNFAGIDAFLEMVNPIIRKHGIVLHIGEIGDVELVTINEKKGPAVFAKFVYKLWVTGLDGDVTPESQQTVFLRFVGPQTTGQALAYVAKMYWRFLLQIPTGDKDADLQEQADVVAPETKVDQADITKTLNDIWKLQGMGELKVFWSNLVKNFKDIAADAKVIEAKDKMKAKFTPETDKKLDDEIPY